MRNRRYEKTVSVGVEDVKQETGRAKSVRRRQAVERQEEVDRYYEDALGSTQTMGRPEEENGYCKIGRERREEQKNRKKGKSIIVKTGIQASWKTGRGPVC
jgi:hypothetical protein